MKEKLLRIILITLVIITSVVMLSGCKKNISKTTKREITDNINEVVKNIDADVVINGTMQGGEITENVTYYINYDESKLYVLDKVTYYKMQGPNDPHTVMAPTETSLIEYTLSDKDMKELKDFINSENTVLKGGSKYKITVGDKQYDMKEFNKFDELIGKITDI